MWLCVCVCVYDSFTNTHSSWNQPLRVWNLLGRACSVNNRTQQLKASSKASVQVALRGNTQQTAVSTVMMRWSSRGFKGSAEPKCYHDKLKARLVISSAIYIPMFFQEELISEQWLSMNPPPTHPVLRSRRCDEFSKPLVSLWLRFQQVVYTVFELAENDSVRGPDTFMLHSRCVGRTLRTFRRR